MNTVTLSIVHGYLLRRVCAIFFTSTASLWSRRVINEHTSSLEKTGLLSRSPLAAIVINVNAGMHPSLTTAYHLARPMNRRLFESR